MPQLERITLHPIKSLDGLDVGGLERRARARRERLDEHVAEVRRLVHAAARRQRTAALHDEAARRRQRAARHDRAVHLQRAVVVAAGQRRLELRKHLAGALVARGGHGGPLRPSAREVARRSRHVNKVSGRGPGANEAWLAVLPP